MSCSPTVLVHRVIAALRHRQPRMMAHRPRRDGLGGEAGRTAHQGERCRCRRLDEIHCWRGGSQRRLSAQGRELTGVQVCLVDIDIDDTSPLHLRFLDGRRRRRAGRAAVDLTQQLGFALVVGGVRGRAGGWELGEPWGGGAGADTYLPVLAQEAMSSSDQFPHPPHIQGDPHPCAAASLLPTLQSVSASTRLSQPTKPTLLP